MSPAAAAKVREVKATTGTGVVKVHRNENQITVTWLCGGARSFTVEELRRQIDWLDKHGSKYLMWFNNPDSTGRKFYVKLASGKLTANESAQDNGTVSWANLKRALQATIKEVAEG